MLHLRQTYLNGVLYTSCEGPSTLETLHRALGQCQLLGSASVSLMASRMRACFLRVLVAWSFALAVLRALLGTSWRSLGGSGPPFIDFVDFPVTLKIIEKRQVFIRFRQHGNNPGLFHGGTGPVEACRPDQETIERCLRTPGCGAGSVH